MKKAISMAEFCERWNTTPESVRCLELFSEYIHTYRRSTFGTLIRAFAVSKAAELPVQWVQYFCKLVKLEMDSSRFRKYCRIGSQFNRLVQRADNLPLFVSSLDLLVDLSDDALARAISTGAIHKWSTSREVAVVVSSAPPVITGDAP